MDNKTVETTTLTTKTLLLCVCLSILGSMIFSIALAYCYGSRLTALEKDVEYLKSGRLVGK